jgi:hypothetical protein
VRQFLPAIRKDRGFFVPRSSDDLSRIDLEG